MQKNAILEYHMLHWKIENFTLEMKEKNVFVKNNLNRFSLINATKKNLKGILFIKKISFLKYAYNRYNEEINLIPNPKNSSERDKKA